MKSIYRSWVLTYILLLMDGVCLAATWLNVYFVRLYLNPDNGHSLFGLISEPINPSDGYVRSLIYLVPLWLAIYGYYEHYSHRERLSGLNELTRIFKAAMAIMITTFAAAFLLKEYSLGRSIVIIFSMLSFLYLYVSRSILRWCKGRNFSSGHGLLKTIVIGAGETGRNVASRISSHPDVGYQFAGFIDDDPELQDSEILGKPVLGKLSDLKSLVEKDGIEVVFIAIPSMSQDVMLNLIVECEDFDVSFHVVSHAFEVITDKSRLDVMAEVPVHRLPGGQMPLSHALAKRVLDLAVSIPILLVSLLWMIPVAIFIKLTSNGPAIFSQERVGFHGKNFTMFKFRTMKIDVPQYAEAPTNPKDDRITGIGRFLRKYSLDEFPQLWNVIRGDMSLIGPRPEMPFIVKKYEEWQRYRLTVKPGVTGLWQIIGRKNLPLELHMEYDLYYIKNQSLLLDLLILFKTIPAVLFGRGAF